MDVSNILISLRSPHYLSGLPFLKGSWRKSILVKSILVEKDIPPRCRHRFFNSHGLSIQRATGASHSLTHDLFLTHFLYPVTSGKHIPNQARDDVQFLVATLFSIPTQSSPEGPLGQLHNSRAPNHSQSPNRRRNGKSLHT
jgi:hypothetical protein